MYTSLYTAILNRILRPLIISGRTSQCWTTLLNLIQSGFQTQDLLLLFNCILLIYGLFLRSPVLWLWWQHVSPSCERVSWWRVSRSVLWLLWPPAPGRHEAHTADLWSRMHQRTDGSLYCWSPPGDLQDTRDTWDSNLKDWSLTSSFDSSNVVFCFYL